MGLTHSKSTLVPERLYACNKSAVQCENVYPPWCCQAQTGTSPCWQVHRSQLGTAWNLAPSVKPNRTARASVIPLAVQVHQNTRGNYSRYHDIHTNFKTTTTSTPILYTKAPKLERITLYHFFSHQVKSMTLSIALRQNAVQCLDCRVLWAYAVWQDTVEMLCAIIIIIKKQQQNSVLSLRISLMQ